MDSWGRRRSWHDSMNSIALCLVVDASRRRSWWYHSFLSVPKSDSTTAEAAEEAFRAAARALLTSGETIDGFVASATPG